MSSLLGAVLLLLGNAFFVGAEFSLIASRRTVLQPQAPRSAPTRIALRAMDQLPLMIAGSQLGVTVCSLGLGAVAEPALAHPLRQVVGAVGLPAPVAEALAFVLALGVVVFAHTVIGEMVPKNVTLAGPERAVLLLGPPMLWFCLATKPLLACMRWAARQVLRLWRIDAADAVKTVFTADELAALVSESRTEGLLDRQEHARITGALALRNTTAGQAVRPWASVATVDQDVTADRLEQVATQTGLSRFPVLARDRQRVIGFVHVKDVLAVDEAERYAPLPARVIRPLPSIPPERSLAEALVAMRQERRHIVLVGAGGMPLGMLALDDVLRAVVGSQPAAVRTVSD
jgi:CBS domain containing-hemolysin-like protein